MKTTTLHSFWRVPCGFS